MEESTDIFIIGGGINGAGIAADAVGRGLSVILCEKGDLASGTSSHSTKLIHGGLRYLENYEFNLVKEALKEREILLQAAPHLVHPLKFILPYVKRLRPSWMIRLGLLLYDYLYARKYIPRSQSISFSDPTYLDILKPTYYKGFSYYDCFTDDSRLVIENALSAAQKGAKILTHTEFLSAERDGETWRIQLKNKKTNAVYELKSKALINTAGPWVKQVNDTISSDTKFAIELIKGSHIVVPKFYKGNFAYILQHNDKRIIFVIPYHENFTLIGTTDVIQNETVEPKITTDEITYLLQAINFYFKKSIAPNNIVWTYSGVRCLQYQPTEKPSSASREYKIIINSKDNSLPLLTVIGGKLTSYRYLAEDALEQLKSYFPKMGAAWTAAAQLPGGKILDYNFNRFVYQLLSDYNELPKNLLIRYASSYGTRTYSLLTDVSRLSDLGEYYGAGLYQKEIEFLIKNEWAQTSEDILWRRTKLGLSFPKENINKLDSFIKSFNS